MPNYESSYDFCPLCLVDTLPILEPTTCGFDCHLIANKQTRGLVTFVSLHILQSWSHETENMRRSEVGDIFGIIYSMSV